MTFYIQDSYSIKILLYVINEKLCPPIHVFTVLTSSFSTGSLTFLPCHSAACFVQGSSSSKAYFLSWTENLSGFMGTILKYYWFQNFFFVEFLLAETHPLCCLLLSLTWCQGAEFWWPLFLLIITWAVYVKVLCFGLIVIHQHLSLRALDAFLSNNVSIPFSTGRLPLELSKSWFRAFSDGKVQVGERSRSYIAKDTPVETLMRSSAIIDDTWKYII